MAFGCLDIAMKVLNLKTCSMPSGSVAFGVLRYSHESVKPEDVWHAARRVAFGCLDISHESVKPEDV